jgi:hypothetical protein
VIVFLRHLQGHPYRSERAASSWENLESLRPKRAASSWESPEPLRLKRAAVSWESTEQLGQNVALC